MCKIYNKISMLAKFKRKEKILSAFKNQTIRFDRSIVYSATVYLSILNIVSLQNNSK